MIKLLLTVFLFAVPALSMAHSYGNGRAQTWDFSDGPLVPYIEAGIGWSFIDSNVASRAELSTRLFRRKHCGGSTRVL